MTTPADAPNINYQWAGLIVEELIRCGVAGFVISPGSRNSPLSISAARHPAARAWVHFDERGAAFFALGLARQTGCPAVLICTSGSAVANNLPAAVEASASQIPLLIVSADRPPELIDCGANQAIEQPGIFGRYVRWEATLPCPTPAIDPAYVLTTVDQAVARCFGGNAGPVHLNCMFREPLAPVAGPDAPPHDGAGLDRWRQTTEPWTVYSAESARLSDHEQAGILDRVQTCARGLLVFGALRDPAERAAARALSEALGWPVLADVCAGLRGPGAPGSLMRWGDLILLDETIDDAWTPAFVIHAGGALTSKRTQQALERWRPEYLRVCLGGTRRDPGHIVTQRCDVAPADFCAWLAACLTGYPPGAPPAAWRARDAACEAAIAAWEAQQPGLTEIGAARIVAGRAPEGATVFLGNSMPVRLADSYAWPARDGVAFVANRGASGIDGNLATAAGLAAASGGPVIALVGDLTALHDLNSLALMRSISTPLVVVVLNNDGGGIFHHLPIAAEHDVFERCFGTPHGLRFGEAAAQFGLCYANPSGAEALGEALDLALAASSPTLIEVTLGRNAEHAVHLDLRARLREAMERARP